MTHKLSNVDLEKEMHDMGISRYRAKLARAVETRQETNDPAVKWLMSNAVSKLSEGIEVYKERHPQIDVVKGPFSQLDSEVLALITCKSVLDSISLERKWTYAAGSVGSEVEDEIRFQALYSQMRAQVERLKKSRKWKMRNDYYHRRLLLVRLAKKNGLAWTDWDFKFRVKVGIILLDLMTMYTGLVVTEMRKIKSKSHLMLVPSNETVEWLAKSREQHEVMYPVFMPSTTTPSDWTTMHDGGYHTNLVVRRPLIKTGDKEHLQSAGQCDMGRVLDAVNILQKTGWTINVPILQVMQDAWDSSLEIGNMPKSSPIPLPPHPHDWDTNEEARKVWKRTAHKIHTANHSARSRRLYIARTLGLARKFVGNTFYYPYSCDFRGRIYPTPAFMQPQGPSEARGLIRFATPVTIKDQKGCDWFLLQGPNKFGYDKVSFKDRLQWVKTNEAAILESASNPLNCRWWWDADSPWEFLAWALEYREFVKGNGLSTAIPVALDGSNNGLQIYSLLMRDPVSAAATNCCPSTPDQSPRDIYQDVADLVTERLKFDVEGSTDQRHRTWAHQWLQFFNGRMPRSCSKRPVMTLPYGSTRHSCQKYIDQWYLDEVVSRGGFETHDIFSLTRYQACNYLATLVWESIGVTVQSARICMKFLQEVANAVSAESKALWWTSPSGFLVKQAYTDYDVLRVRTVTGGTSRNIKLHLDNDTINSRKQRQGIAPNFVHSLDAAALVETVLLAHQRGVTDFAMIHDSYGTTARDSTVLAECLREAYVSIFSKPVLEDFLEQVRSVLDDPSALPAVPERGTLSLEGLRQSTYFFS